MIVSSDEIRSRMGDINDQSQNAKVFEEVERQLKDYIERGRSVIFDATNISYKKRRDWLNRFNKYNIYKIAVLVATPYEECIARNARRKRIVPEEVIKRMYNNFYIPQYYEGFNEIQIRYNSDYHFGFYQLEDIEHDNPHHTSTVLEHCVGVVKCLGNVKKELMYAGLLHDIGKLKTKTYVNTKGEVTEIAHFYNHEKVSAYDSLFHSSLRRAIEDCREKNWALNVIKLIQWHMVMHFNLSEKTIKKYKELLGESTWHDLELLHDADCEAR